jgi:hypothetical protein
MADPVFFNRASAERIANAVRKVEIGDRSESALRFRRELPQQQRKTFRIATFTGAWAINATKTVTFKYQTSTPNTAAVTNLFFPFPTPSGATDCAIAKDGTAWFLIDVPFESATAVFASGTASQTVVSNITVASSFSALTTALTIVSGVAVAAVLDTSNCAITVSTTQTTSQVTLTTGGSVASTVTKSTATIAVVTGTYTSTFIRFKVT